MPKHALLLGYGYLGRQVAERLRCDPDMQLAVVKRTALTDESATRFIGLDLSSQEAVAALAAFLPSRLDLVFINLSPATFTKEDYARAYPQSLATLLSALRIAALKPVIVLSSSTSVYDVHDGSWVDESDSRLVVPGQGSPAAEIRAAESRLLASEFAAMVARLGGIYGPGRERFLTSLIEAEIGLNEESEQRYTNRIHRDDAAEALVYLAKNYQPTWRGVVNVVDSDPASQAELVRWVSEQMGREPPMASKTMQRQRRGNKRVANRKLLSLGANLRYPSFREGYREALQNQLRVRQKEI